MTTVVDVIYSELRDAGKLLSDSGELSLQVTLDSHTRKTILLSAASFFEVKLSREVREFADEVTSSNQLIGSLIQSNVISRQYHTWFDWKTGNANAFFGMFGKVFKDYMDRRLKEDENLLKSIQSFMEIGRERNLLVHSDYASYPINKTPEEVYMLYKSAIHFVDSIGAELRACSVSLRAIQP